MIDTADRPLQVDPNRRTLHEATGLYVRAQFEGKWGSHDIAELDKESLTRWLADKPASWWADIIGILLGHGHLNP